MAEFTAKGECNLRMWVRGIGFVLMVGGFIFTGTVLTCGIMIVGAVLIGGSFFLRS